MAAPDDPRDGSPTPKLVDCKACGKQVSKTAVLCPHCGQVAPGPTIRRTAVIVACLLALVLLVLGIGKIIGDIQAANLQYELEKLRYDRQHQEH